MRFLLPFLFLLGWALTIFFGWGYTKNEEVNKVLKNNLKSCYSDSDTGYFKIATSCPPLSGAPEVKIATTTEYYPEYRYIKEECPPCDNPECPNYEDKFLIYEQQIKELNHALEECYKIKQ